MASPNPSSRFQMLCITAENMFSVFLMVLLALVVMSIIPASCYVILLYGWDTAWWTLLVAILFVMMLGPKSKLKLTTRNPITGEADINCIQFQSDGLPS